MKGERAHHLAKHCLSGEIDLHLHFGTTDPKEVGKEIARLGQKQLQMKFNHIFAAKTYSNNNQWLRRKLLEAAGLQAPRSTGRGRAAQPKRSPSPADGSAGSSAPSPGTVRGVMAESSSTAARAFLHTSSNEVRRTKRKRQPRTFDDMLPLDPQAEATSEFSSDAEGALTDPDFDLHGSDTTSPTVRSAKTVRLHGPSRPDQWRSHSGSSLSSGISGQSQLAFANYFEANNRRAYNMAHAHQEKSAHHRAHSDRSQLIRANTINSSSDMQYSPPHISNWRRSSNMGAQHAQALQYARQSTSPHCQYDLGANCVRIATPHSTAAASRVLNMQLLLRQQHAASSQQPTARRSHAPLSVYTELSCPHMASQPSLLDQSRLEHEVSAGGYEDEAFAVSCLNQQHDSILNEICDYRAHASLEALPAALPAGCATGGTLTNLASYQPEGRSAQSADSLRSHASPSASSMHGMDHARGSVLPPSAGLAGPCSSAATTPMISAPISTTPMDMIMLHSLNSVPAGELPGGSELLPDSMLLDEAMLALPIV